MCLNVQTVIIFLGIVVLISYLFLPFWIKFMNFWNKEMYLLHSRVLYLSKLYFCFIVFVSIVQLHHLKFFLLSILHSNLIF